MSVRRRQRPRIILNTLWTTSNIIRGAFNQTLCGKEPFRVRKHDLMNVSTDSPRCSVLGTWWLCHGCYQKSKFILPIWFTCEKLFRLSRHHHNQSRSTSARGVAASAKSNCEALRRSRAWRVLFAGYKQSQHAANGSNQTPRMQIWSVDHSDDPGLFRHEWLQRS